MAINRTIINAEWTVFDYGPYIWLVGYCEVVNTTCLRLRRQHVRHKTHEQCCVFQQCGSSLRGPGCMVTPPLTATCVAQLHELKSIDVWIMNIGGPISMNRRKFNAHSKAWYRWKGNVVWLFNETACKSIVLKQSNIPSACIIQCQSHRSLSLAHCTEAREKHGVYSHGRRRQLSTRQEGDCETKKISSWELLTHPTSDSLSGSMTDTYCKLMLRIFTSFHIKFRVL